ncbi:MAG TPA: serine carboxypeptidase, partial [bacterium]|nr:serine carboxypeptidase [bacterium]
KQVQDYARWVFPIITKLPYELLQPSGKRAESLRPRHKKWFKWAEVIVGDYHHIRRYAPLDLTGKVLITNTLTPADEEELKARGVHLVVTTTPELGGRSHGTNVLEAMFVALLGDQGYVHDPAAGGKSNFRDEYLNLILDAGIEPRILELNPPKKPARPTFAFVIHPLRVSDAFQVKAFAWLRNLPPKLLELLLANVPPMFISKARGIVDADGNEIDGYFYALIMTPKMMLAADPEDVYRGLVKIWAMAKARGARIMGLGAFTSVVGDAGQTVAKWSPIPVTSGNSLTIWACVESAREAMARMGKPMHEVRAMVVGATGSIGRAVTRVLAEEVAELYIVSRRPEKVLEFTREIQVQGVKAEGGTLVDPFIGRADLIIATTTDPGGVIDVMKLKPGCVVVDVARPPDVSPEEAGKRDDILVIESGEIRCPGNPSWGVDLGLPPGIAFACLTETMVLTFEKRYESYTLGREIDVAKVHEIGALAQKHGFVLSGIYSFGKPVSDAEIAQIRARAEAKTGRRRTAAAAE